MKENEKKNNSITEVKPKYKVDSFYRDIVTNKEFPVSKNWILGFFEQWVRWARDDENAYNAKKFPLYKGVPWETIMNWIEKHQDLNLSYRQVQELIGLRREQKYIETNGSALAFMMPHYDKDYREQHEWRAYLKAKELSQQKANVTVVIPDITTKNEL